MPANFKLTADMMIDQAIRMETIGRKGVWFNGQLRSSSELRKLAGEPLFPLPPFNAYEYHRMYKENGPSSSNRD